MYGGMTGTRFWSAERDYKRKTKFDPKDLRYQCLGMRRDKERSERYLEMNAVQPSSTADNVFRNLQGAQGRGERTRRAHGAASPQAQRYDAPCVLQSRPDSAADEHAQKPGQGEEHPKKCGDAKQPSCHCQCAHGTKEVRGCSP